MRVVCIIPARGGSKGIPHKNIMDFCGKPLIAWSIEAALQSGVVSEVYVNTDDADIADVSVKYGAYVIERPPELATDTASTEPVIAQSLESIKDVNIIIHLQPTSPVRTSQDIKQAVDLFIKENADTVFSSFESSDMCLWKFDKLKKTYDSFTFDYRNRGRRQDREPLFLENGSIYVFKPDNLKKYGGRIGGKIVMYNMPLWKSYEIDEIGDVKICEYFMKSNLLNEDTWR